MKLYFMPRTRAIRPLWLLEELEVPYDLVKLDPSKQENKSAEYLAIQPFGEVPALVDGELILFETAAICLYLADRLPEKQLAPPPESPERGRYYQWVAFAERSLEPVVLEFYGLAQVPEAERADAVRGEGLEGQRSRLNQALDVIEAEVRDRDFLAGGRFTAADLVTASILHLANTLKLLEERPRLMEYTYLHCKRPALRRAVSR